MIRIRRRYLLRSLPPRVTRSWAIRTVRMSTQRHDSWFSVALPMWAAALAPAPAPVLALTDVKSPNCELPALRRKLRPPAACTRVLWHLPRRRRFPRRYWF